jgi:hypothetical protein
MSFLAELKHRHVVRVALACSTVAIVLAQLAVPALTSTRARDRPVRRGEQA